jgi:hypothetical protein
MADNNGGLGSFGSCCTDLKDVMGGEDFEPLVTVADNGVLYMSVGLIEEGDEGGMVDHPVFFCPFCGTKLQSEDDVRAKGGFEDEAPTA